MKPVSFFMFFALELKRICTYLVKVGEPQETVSNILQPMNSPLLLICSKIETK